MNIIIVQKKGTKMLLFSTILELKDTVSPDDFIQLVLKWNDTSSHIENRVDGIDWHGEHSVRYGTDNLWLEFVELPEKNIIAVCRNFGNGLR